MIHQLTDVNLVEIRNCDITFLPLPAGYQYHPDELHFFVGKKRNNFLCTDFRIRFVVDNMVHKGDIRNYPGWCISYFFVESITVQPPVVWQKSGCGSWIQIHAAVPVYKIKYDRRIRLKIDSIIAHKRSQLGF